jgi:cell division protein FtsX
MTKTVVHPFLLSAKFSASNWSDDRDTSNIWHVIGKLGEFDLEPFLRESVLYCLLGFV